MEETQKIDFDDLLTEEEEPVQAAFPQVLLDCAALCQRAAYCTHRESVKWFNCTQVVGELQMISEPTDRLPLYLGELRFVIAYCLRSCSL